MGDIPVRFWRCPVRAHRGGYPEPLRVTVEWRDGVAYCTTAECGRSSVDRSTDGSPAGDPSGC